MAAVQVTCTVPWVCTAASLSDTWVSSDSALGLMAVVKHTFAFLVKAVVTVTDTCESYLLISVTALGGIKPSSSLGMLL